jgi:hypothetical protein
MNSLFLIGISLLFSATAFAGNSLTSFTGQPSPMQHLSCSSHDTNISITVQGNSASVSSNDLPGNYTCTGIISKLGSDLNCVLASGEAPQKFELHVGADLSAQFSFSGNDGFVQGFCSF